MVEDAPPGSDLSIEVVKRAPMIAALREGAMDRRDLEQRLGISKSTAHRNTNALSEWGLIERPDIALDIMENYPKKCIELCASEFLTMRLHEALPFGLVIFDSRIGVGVRDRVSGAPRAFVDTDTPAARTWAETLFESYWSEAVRLDRFNPKALREAIDSDA